MRKITLFLSLVLVSFYSCKTQTKKGANGVSYGSAQEYNDYIVKRQTILMQDVMDFVKVSQNDLDSAERMLDNFVTKTKTMTTEIKGMPAYKSDSTLRDAAVDIFGFYARVFDSDYRDLIHLKKEQNGTSQEIEDRIMGIVKKVTQEEAGYDNKFQSAQKNFAQKNNLKLLENEMQKKFDKEVGK